MQGTTEGALWGVMPNINDGDFPKDEWLLLIPAELGGETCFYVECFDSLENAWFDDSERCPGGPLHGWLWQRLPALWSAPEKWWLESDDEEPEEESDG